MAGVKAGQTPDSPSPSTALVGQACSQCDVLDAVQAEHARLQVLVFSQFKIMLDVIEDALRLAGMPLERIDGSTPQRARQSAIDRFSQGARFFCDV